uniref:Uncharacterized protein n=1 Tax=Arundo donax TaxID=35708 RepID=A0A0A9ELF7_ARUDO
MLFGEQSSLNAHRLQSILGSNNAPNTPQRRKVMPPFSSHQVAEECCCGR